MPLDVPGPANAAFALTTGLEELVVPAAEPPTADAEPVGVPGPPSLVCVRGIRLAFRLLCIASSVKSYRN